jgi:hypothetical protein
MTHTLQPLVDATQDRRTELAAELVGTSIEITLLEERQRDVRTLLQHARSRRSGIARQYRQLLNTPSAS